jgi:hypothetical protein
MYRFRTRHKGCDLRVGWMIRPVIMPALAPAVHDSRPTSSLARRYAQVTAIFDLPPASMPNREVHARCTAGQRQARQVRADRDPARGCRPMRRAGPAGRPWAFHRAQGAKPCRAGKAMIAAALPAMAAASAKAAASCRSPRGDNAPGRPSRPAMHGTERAPSMIYPGGWQTRRRSREYSSGTDEPAVR